MSRNPMLVARLERLEQTFPGLSAALQEECLEVATVEELQEMGRKLENIEAFERLLLRVRQSPPASAAMREFLHEILNEINGPPSKTFEVRDQAVSRILRILDEAPHANA